MDKNINHIISRVLSGEASINDILGFSQWLGESPENREEFNLLKSYWEADVSLKNASSNELCYANVNAKINNKGKSKPRRFLLYTLSIASMLAVLMGVGVLLNTYLQGRGAHLEDKDFVVTVDKGQRATITLPDGTVVWLNSYTNLKYSGGYGQEKRVVSLEGEAYFDVAPMKDCKFIVQAGGMEVEALGTAFNVRAYTEDEDITTTLFSGKVKVAMNKATGIAGTDLHECMLEAGQYASFRKESNKLIAGVSEHPEFAEMWRRNELALDGQTLEQIAGMLNRMYNVNVQFASDKVRNHRFRGSILNRSLDNVFELISLTAPITYTSKADTIFIDEKR